MTDFEIIMSVAESLMYDELENLETIEAHLNSDDGPSWKASRGQPYSEAEIRGCLISLARARCVTFWAESPSSGFAVERIELAEVGVVAEWPDLWFRLEPVGRGVFENWWESEGKRRFGEP